ncbi:helix-turn-helix transcriptional regulator [Paenibacillus koleovorans]|uniref:helix-turn-helix transcriptional regulator n=1 Tax=Paenibacillus koleovorans TaxID=121608 RepID=UPI000FDB31A2|nr:AraC family transcriptional regulator [Paenibacillus koleovorans]
MRQSRKLFMESLTLQFRSIMQYDLRADWAIQSRRLGHAVLWAVEEGRFHLNVNGVGQEAGERDVLLIPKGAILTCYARTPSLKLISLNFDADITFLLSASWAELLRLPPRYPYETTGLLEILREMLDYEGAVDSVTRPLKLHSGLYRLIAHYLEQLFLHEDEGDGEITAKAASGIDWRVQASMEYIARHADRFPAPDELSGVVRISESYLRRLFHEQTGLSPLHYMHRFKVELARKRLESTDERISEIGYALGYEDPNYFSRTFRKLTGMTPKEYREQHQSWIALE